MNTKRGALALVLHSHMPYVEGLGTWPFGEEWLWEAVACVYLPLLEVIDGAPLTVGLTPVLCDQLETMTGEAGERYLAFLREIRAPVHEEDAASLERGGEPALAAEVRRAAGDYTWASEAFERRGRDLLAAFRSLASVELWTSAATHALLPHLATDAGLRLQLATGVASHIRRFGDFGGGLWLPECAYAAGLERDLAEHGVRAFCVDQTEILGHGAPAHLQPVITEAGPVAVPIDWQAVELVWNEREGYPGHGAYRDYHHRTLHDLKPWDNAGRPYDRRAALALAAEHARDFVSKVAERLRDGGLLCCALDTELLGHWWYEGTEWLRAVLDEAAEQGLALARLDEALERHPPALAPPDLPATTWGTPRTLHTWSGPQVADLAWSARNAELRVVGAGAAAGKRAVRELLLAQSSDWAFMVTRELAIDYGRERAAAHAAAAVAALDLHSGAGRVRNAAPYCSPSTLLVPAG